MLPDMRWFSVPKTDHRAVSLYARHYSSLRGGKTITDWLRSGITPPGESMTLLTSDSRALFVWLKQQYSLDGQAGVNCAVFRNEGDYTSSGLILEAEQLAWQRWPGERLYTYVDASAIHSTNPGYCFKMAGWTRLDEKTGRGLLILEKLPQSAPALGCTRY